MKFVRTVIRNWPNKPALLQILMFRRRIIDKTHIGRCQRLQQGGYNNVI